MKRPSAHKIGDLGETIVRKVFLKAGWIVEKCDSDYAYDFIIQPCVDNAPSQAFAFVQVKSNASQFKRTKKGDLKFNLQSKHLNHWFMAPYPIFICFVEVENERIYIVTAQDAIKTIRKRKGETWLSTKSSMINISEKSEVDKKRIVALEINLIKFWNQLKSEWNSAKIAASMGESLYTSWMYGCWVLQTIMFKEMRIYNEFGKEKADLFFRRSGIVPIWSGNKSDEIKK